MDVKRTSKWLLALMLLLFATCGANCRQMVRQYTEPRTLPEAATLEQIAERVNSNTAKIISAQSSGAKLKADGAPQLGANIAIMPQRRLHLQGSLMGPRIDLGSNEEQFWVWIKDNQPPAVFVCRHDQFAESNARQLLPIEPERFIEAFGLTHIDPTLVIAPPQVVGANRIEIASRLPSQLGELKKITIVDGWNGLVIEQHIYDHLGMTLASSFTSNYKHDPTSGAAMPRSIDIRWAKMGFKLDVSDWIINQIPPENTALWEVPHPQDYPIVDLADPTVQFVDPQTPAAMRPGAPSAAARRPIHGAAALPPRGTMQPLNALPPRDTLPPRDSLPQGAIPIDAQPIDMPPIPPEAIHPAAGYPPTADNPLR